MDNDELERRVQAALKAERAKNPDPPPNWETLEILIRERIRRQMEEEVVRMIGMPSDEDSPPSAQDFLAMEFPARKPVLGPWCTQQLTFIYAPTGSYKSLFALGLAYALAEGIPFCGWESVRTQRVLYVDGEMTAADVQQRLKNAKASERLFIANIPTWGAERGIEPPNLATEEGQQLITSWILKRDIDLVILDNLMSLAWKDNTSMISDELWQPVRRWCIEQRSAERSVIIVDHTNASGEIFGSKTKLWHVDQAIRIDPVAEDKPLEGFDLKVPERKFKMRFTKERGAAEPQPDQIVTTADVGLSWSVESAASELEKKAIQMKKDGLTIRDIAEELGTSKSKVGRWVRDVSQ